MAQTSSKIEGFWESRFDFSDGVYDVSGMHQCLFGRA